MSDPLPARPHLEWLRKTAKDRLRELRAGGNDVATLADAEIATFLAHVGAGHLDQVQAMLDAAPALANKVGPHPFWGGRPQALHVAIEAKRRDLFDLLIARGADVNGSNDLYDEFRRSCSPSNAIRWTCAMSCCSAVRAWGWSKR